MIIELAKSKTVNKKIYFHLFYQHISEQVVCSRKYPDKPTDTQMFMFIFPNYGMNCLKEGGVFQSSL